MNNEDNVDPTIPAEVTVSRGKTMWTMKTMWIMRTMWTTIIQPQNRKTLPDMQKTGLAEERQCGQ